MTGKESYFIEMYKTLGEAKFFQTIMKLSFFDHNTLVFCWHTKEFINLGAQEIGLFLMLPALPERPPGARALGK